MSDLLNETAENLLRFTEGKKYKTIYADPPWQFQNRTGKVAPEHGRLTRYSTMTLEDIKALPVEEIADEIGYSSSSSFINMFVKKVGYSPKQYRKFHQSH